MAPDLARRDERRGVILKVADADRRRVVAELAGVVRRVAAFLRQRAQEAGLAAATAAPALDAELAEVEVVVVAVVVVVVVVVVVATVAYP